MALGTPARRVRRPVFIASYGGISPDASGSSEEEEAKVVDLGLEAGRQPRLRQHFPPAGSDRDGGTSDGYCFRIAFAAGRLERSYDMVRQFLREEGYERVPLPETADELRAFRLPPKLRHQLSLFGEDGYVHNPIKVLFPPPGGKRGALLLELYDERAANHLLRFHRRR